MSTKNKVPLPTIINRDEVLRRVSWLGPDWDGTGALVLPECHMNSSERMTLALIHAAADEGAAVANYTSVTEINLEKDRVGAITVTTEDGSRLVVNTKAIANCAGPWLDRIDRLAAKTGISPISSFSRGSHLILKGVELECGLALPTPQKIQGVTGRGGRHVFMIPWRDHVILGTSYAPHEADIDHVVPTVEDREQLLDAVNSALGSTLITQGNVVHAFSGIYPITAASVKSDQYQGASDYVITDYGRLGGPRGYFSVFGAKFTTARKLAELACNSIVRQMELRAGPCITRNTRLRIADVDDPDTYCGELAHRYAEHTDRQTIDHLFENYGTDAMRILDIAADEPDLLVRISEDRATIAAEAVYCARNEMLEHLDDFVFRRTGLGTIGSPGHAAVSRCALLVGRELGWSEDQKQRELAATLANFPYAESEAV